jgi:2-polyprenyl-6-methoxyphenol hydroxylase-like FAD-dependent oxidoreductase
MPSFAGTQDGVVIVGAGIGGLTLAGELQRRGVHARVIEQSPTVPWAGAGIVLHPNALACLGDLRGELRTQGAVLERQRNTDRAGRTSEVAWADVWGEHGLPIAIHRRRLAELLLARLEPQTVRWGERVSAIAQQDDRVTVELASGEQLHGGVVVGADGVHSVVRPEVDADASVEYLGQMYWRLTVRREPPFDFEEWRVWRGEHAFFGGMPVGGGRVHVFLQLHVEAPLEVPEAEALARMLEHVRTLGPEAEALARAIVADEGVHVGPARGVRATQWARHRAAIIGDAAHAVSPIMTQGGAMAIEDAVVLAEEIARHGTRPPALVAFAARRRERVGYVARMSRVHLMLIGKPVPTTDPRPAASGPGADTDWLRRLYAPLGGAP